jgi:hypothetical protein
VVGGQVALDLIRPDVAGLAPVSRRAVLGSALRRAAGAGLGPGSSGSRMAAAVRAAMGMESGAADAERQREGDRRFRYLVEVVCRWIEMDR